MKVYTMDEDESWELFVKSAGDIANLEQIQPFTKEIVRECDGLPLAITVIGTSMRGKTRVELWEDALNSLRMSEPHSKDVIDKVYKVIKWSFDSLESQGIELSSKQRSKRVNKNRGDIQSYFLYCSLYPAAIPTDDLIHCLWAEGFLGEHDTYEEAYNRGITMIESLKDACLLEAHGMNSVKMHDVVRDVARWVANSFGDEHNSIFQAGIGLTNILHIKVSACVKRISFISNQIGNLSYYPQKFPETTTLLLQDNDRLWRIADELLLSFPSLRVLNLSETAIEKLPSCINSLYQLHALILQNCRKLTELPPIGNLCNLQVLDCYYTKLHWLPEGMDKLTNLRLLNMLGSCIELACFDEISSLRNLTSLFIKFNSSSIYIEDPTWMTRLKRFHIEVGKSPMEVPFNKSTRMIGVANCEIFSCTVLSGMLQFVSDLYLTQCMGLRKLIVCNSFDGLKTLYIRNCSCHFRPVEEGNGLFDPLPNLEYLHLKFAYHLKSVSDFNHLLNIRFSKLRQLDISNCESLTCLFNVGGAFSAPKHLEDVRISDCEELVELFMQTNSEVPRIRKLWMDDLKKLGALEETQSMWEHMEELTLIGCRQIRKLPLFIQTSNNIKVIRGDSEWWRQLEWDDDDFKLNQMHCFRPYP
ncbi:hypothetical protein KY289_036878 [Solanum tuberosum]|nr:hypothetical protein KY289_036878 [Solanum tuberosum]